MRYHTGTQSIPNIYKGESARSKNDKNNILYLIKRELAYLLTSEDYMKLLVETKQKKNEMQDLKH